MTYSRSIEQVKHHSCVSLIMFAWSYMGNIHCFIANLQQGKSLNHHIHSYGIIAILLLQRWQEVLGALACHLKLTYQSEV